MRVLFLSPYPKGEAPSQRFRYEQYLDLLEERGITYDLAPFLDESTWKIFYKPGQFWGKIGGILKGGSQRLLLLTKLNRYDVVFIHREAAILGPPILEFLICKVWRKKVVFDFDDAIWLKNHSHSNRNFIFLKRYKNANNLCKWATKVSCGNAYLKRHAEQFNDNCVVNPTTIDTDGYHNKIKAYQTGPVVFGWTGTHSTLKYLKPLIPVFKQLEQQYNFKLLIISDQQPYFDLESLEFVRWNKSTEIDDLLRMDVGLMPLTHDKWAEGKCGFKALQYLALGIPALISPVGINKNLIQEGVTGYFADSEEEWKSCLTNVLEQPDNLKNMSKACRTFIEDHYSVRANTANFIHLLS